ncbi:hypothetical protein GETHLI_05710 [Geothrix limicola]|uniref:Uncharacterized protein n=1 Tax=Geothrix limicola TaxID=2927978 RepID=A0ABQ5QB64_9BACT|nr:DUF6526 family protein [Geothrix limicola]GLH72069.1 hypothetical protein GETHLI_05710 [Geothrix limicola]
MSEPQTYASHRRVDPWYHYFVMPFGFLLVCVAAVALFRKPSLHQAFALLGSFAFLMLIFKVRLYALKLQNRLIRLEEAQRMATLLPEDLKARSSELTIPQVVALRFASDAELTIRVREALDEKLSSEAIKKRVQTWRPDTYRI